MFSNQECSGYVTHDNRRICGKSATWWHINTSEDVSRILSFSHEKYNFGLMPLLSRTRSILAYRVKSLICSEFFVNQIRDSAIKSSKAMDEITREYGPQNTLLVILPTKIDARIDRNKLQLANDKKTVDLFLNGLHKKPQIVDLRACPLGKNDFFELDGHPNQLGHSSLSTCFIKNPLA
jgi:hypothetical protein